MTSVVARVATRPWRAPVARVTGLALVLLAVGVGWAARATGRSLGTDTEPFFLTQFPTVPERWWWPLAPLAVSVLGAAVLLRRGRQLGTGWFLAAAFGLALLARAGSATAQRGVAEWWWPFTRPTGRRNEYAAAFDVVDGDPLGFVDRFAELVPTLPVHPSGHPPGATLLAWALDGLAGGVEGYAVTLMVLGAAAVWPVHVIGRRLAGEAAARRAVLLWAFAPSTLLYGAVSFDGMLVLVSSLAVAALLTGRIALGAVGAAAAFLLSYALALAPLWAVLTLGRARGLRVAAVCAAVGLVALLGLVVLADYDPLGAVRATHAAYQRGIGGQGRPWLYWVVAGPAVFLVFLGPVLAERVLRGVERGTAGARALVACVVLAALSGVMEAEVERIWQFAVPFAAVAAAPLMSRRLVEVALVTAALQAYVVELRWDTSF